MQKYETLEMFRLLKTRHDAQEPDRSEDPKTVFQTKVPPASGSSLSSDYEAFYLLSSLLVLSHTYHPLQGQALEY